MIIFVVRIRGSAGALTVAGFLSEVFLFEILDGSYRSRVFFLEVLLLEGAWSLVTYYL
jgi:hypothetical protein